jgi:hypothetical protein
LLAEKAAAEAAAEMKAMAEKLAAEEKAGFEEIKFQMVGQLAELREAQQSIALNEAFVEKSQAKRPKDAAPITAAQLLQLSEARRGLHDQETFLVAQAAEMGISLDVNLLESTGWIVPVGRAAPSASRFGRLGAAVQRIFVPLSGGRSKKVVPLTKVEQQWPSHKDVQK